MVCSSVTAVRSAVGIGSPAVPSDDNVTGNNS